MPIIVYFCIVCLQDKLVDGRNMVAGNRRKPLYIEGSTPSANSNGVYQAPFFI